MVLHVEKTLKTTIQENFSNLRNLQRKYLLGSAVTVKPFFEVNNSFTYDSQAYDDLMKLCYEPLLDILISSQFKLYRLDYN